MKTCLPCLQLRNFASNYKKFCEKLEQFMEVLEQKIPADKNIFFAHTMAGGIIRSKIFYNSQQSF